MKVKVFRVRIWKFIRRQRIGNISLFARLFGRKTGGRRSGLLPAATGRDHLHTSLVRRESGWYSDTEFEDPGPAITRRRTDSAMASLSVKPEEQALVKKVHSKRHNMQVITMWNPAAESVTTVEAPVESSPKIWLKQASKRWKEHGSGGQFKAGEKLIKHSLRSNELKDLLSPPLAIIIIPRPM
ncbi:unnamed protein product [Calypogeia fissa]